MAMTQNSIVVGVFASQDQARKAIDELKGAGYNDDRIGFVVRADANPDVGVEDVGRPAATGAVSGGVLGGLLGAAASLLIPGFGPAIAGGVLAATLGGAALGATAGGALGILSSIGFSQEDARFYQRALENGNTIVTIKSDVDQDEALAILMRNGASNADIKYSAFNAPPTLRPRPDDENRSDNAL
ncbi:general stress protein [Dictyobacter aurantiacus]|uniref:General stress protein 17M-like domain-containing protein n=1 Tax=Dictyobacter aurantiacus TaxID=1936993 RepID=A0A401ZNF7_9CHLR|nr:general stress protein [Dictyobacter aurantiacus]GCE08438.1 hypothetical protein KDAU_57670 [Dictyobacter aurantiacus]